jgi:type VI secretion system protein ImpJ
MSQLQPVLWSKGVLLSPQHLQTQDRFFESVLTFQLSTLNFSPWGVSRLELDHQALSAGAVAILRASGMFADGLLFDIRTPLLHPSRSKAVGNRINPRSMCISPCPNIGPAS